MVFCTQWASKVNIFYSCQGMGVFGGDLKGIKCFCVKQNVYSWRKVMLYAPPCHACLPSPFLMSNKCNFILSTFVPILPLVFLHSLVFYLPSASALFDLQFFYLHSISTFSQFLPSVIFYFLSWHSTFGYSTFSHWTLNGRT